ncbi:MAG TPA: VOC family protein [Motilibacteraceae bacterium]|nr:VOC family protein [Motilibacteraceae bacterium]
MADVYRYPHGAPCWSELTTPAPDAAEEFYGELFGWEFEHTGVGGYVLCLLDGSPVAGIAPQPPSAAGSPPFWATYLCADDADDVARRIRTHRGDVLAGPVDVGAPDGTQQGRMLMARDPAGAAFGVWQPRALAGSGVRDVHGAPAWAELLTPDPSRAAAFYADVFELAVREEDIGMAQPYRLLLAHDRMVAGVMLTPPAVPVEAPPYWLVYVCVRDADDAVDRLGALGGQVLAGPTPSSWGTWTVAADPQGAVLALLAAPG